MDYADMSDDDLIRRFREGDEHAFWELYRRFRPACFDLKGGPRLHPPPWLRNFPPTLIWSHVTEFEDLFQRVLEDTAKRTYRSGGSASYRTYLQRALRNKVVSWFNAHRPEQDALKEWHTLHRQHTASDPALLAERIQLVSLLEDCIVRLSDNERYVVEQHWVRNHNLAQIGRDLGIREETCRKRHQRAKEHLCNCLARKGFTNQE